LKCTQLIIYKQSTANCDKNANIFQRISAHHPEAQLTRRATHTPHKQRRARVARRTNTQKQLTQTYGRLVLCAHGEVVSWSELFLGEGRG
jgi:hypothetical protein